MGESKWFSRSGESFKLFTRHSLEEEDFVELLKPTQCLVRHLSLVNTVTSWLLVSSWRSAASVMKIVWRTKIRVIHLFVECEDMPSFNCVMWRHDWQHFLKAAQTRQSLWVRWHAAKYCLQSHVLNMNERHKKSEQLLSHSGMSIACRSQKYHFQCTQCIPMFIGSSIQFHILCW